jgi:hypothetical protein
MVLPTSAANARAQDLPITPTIIDTWDLDSTFVTTGVLRDSSGRLYLISNAGTFPDPTYHLHEVSRGGVTVEPVWSFTPGLSFQSLAFDSDGNRYISDWSTISKFSPDGDSLGAWTFFDDSTLFTGPGRGRFAVDEDQFVYALAPSGIRKYTTSGTLVAEWEIVVKHPNGRYPMVPDAVAVDGLGHVLVALRSPVFPEYALRKYTREGHIIAEWPLPALSSYQLAHLAVDGDLVYVLSQDMMASYQASVEAYTTSGHLVMRGVLGSVDEWFYATGIGVDRLGRVLIPHMNPYDFTYWRVSVIAPVTMAVAGAPEPQSAMSAVLGTPARTAFHEPRPNPFRGETALQFFLAEPQAVGFGIYDVAGRLLRRIEPAAFGVGTHALVWDGRDDRGKVAPAGLYFVRLDGETLRATRKVIHLGR